MKWIHKAVGKHWWAVLWMCLLASALAISGVLETLAMRKFIDQAASGNKDGFILGFVLYLCLLFFQLAGGAARNLLGTSVSIKMFNKLRCDVFDKIMTRRYASLQGYGSGDFMQMLYGDCNVVSSTALGLFPGICAIVAQLICSIVCLGMLQGTLLLLLAVCFLGILAASLPFRKIVKKHHTRVMEADGKVKNILQESLSNLQIIRSFQANAGVLAWAQSAMNFFHKTRFRQACVSQVMKTSSILALNVAYIFGLIWCGMGMINGTITFGTFLAVWQLIGKITSPAFSASGMIPQYHTMIASAERLQKVEDMDAEKLDTTKDWNCMKEEFSEIRCTNLSFSYDGSDPKQTKVLSDLNFTIKKGDIIAITGESGIGKSTLLKLLLGIYYSATDAITVCSSSGNEWVLDAGARDMISYVPQGNFLMSGTIREAVHFWQKETVDHDKLRHACMIAEADEWINALEEGYDTRLGERGAGLSEGQLQRLAIARAIYSDKPVLLLDEATSALDEQTEAKVLDNLKKLKDRTVVIVTHRKAALSMCNRIVEMDNGKINERMVK